MAHSPRTKSYLRKIGLSAAAGACLASALVGSSPAQADGGACVSGRLCIYNATSFKTSSDETYPSSIINGNYYDFNNFPSPHTYDNPDSCNGSDGQFNGACNENDTISSVKNTSTKYANRIYTDAHYSGSYEKIAAGSSDTSVTYNNQTSSECFNSDKSISGCNF